MIRIVSEFMDGQKHLLVMCDNQACGEYIVNRINTDNEQESILNLFKTYTTVEMWGIGVIQHLCPRHLKQMMEVVNQNKKLVISANHINDGKLLKM